VNLFAPRCGCADRKHKIIAEPHTICGPRSALFTLRLFVLRIFMLRNLGLKKISLRLPVLVNFSTATFIFQLRHLFYFMPCYILVIIFIVHHLFTAFIATFIICVYVCLPRRFFILFNSFKSKSNPFFTVQYFLIQSRIIRLQL
jgi:hypothetical protein